VAQPGIMNGDEMLKVSGAGWSERRGAGRSCLSQEKF